MPVYTGVPDTANGIWEARVNTTLERREGRFNSIKSSVLLSTTWGNGSGGINSIYKLSFKG